MPVDRIKELENHQCQRCKALIDRVTRLFNIDGWRLCAVCLLDFERACLFGQLKITYQCWLGITYAVQNLVKSNKFEFDGVEENRLLTKQIEVEAESFLAIENWIKGYAGDTSEK